MQEINAEEKKRHLNNDISMFVYITYKKMLLTFILH